ncbi:hypothetical protein ACFO1B_38865 [Dactylosporangium siamense]|uniref:hypothetical protein n=1 Tax=Dactylosporangium siamense TaxID=685454 RepID=UPI001943B077|nr:hypothetical protein [Dactylosporangium siamense]
MPALPFAHIRTRDVARSLARLGYDCDVVAPEALPDSNAVGGQVRAAITGGAAADVLVVYVVSHGHLAASGVYVIGPDGEYEESTNVAGWVAAIEDFPHKPRPTTLFLVDTCHAGAAARLEWLRAAGQGTRAWVIAATSGEGLAYDGIFSVAAGRVLQQIGDGEIDFYPAQDYVPFGHVVEHIRREVARLGGAAQTVCSTPVDGSPSPPFFPNRRPPLAGSLSPARRNADRAALPFLDLDVALDPAHFLDRASGLRAVDDRISAGCFTGRSNQLLHLNRWLAGGTGSICVVTGGPGSGKSALLGIVVCAGHGHLREETRPLWEHLGELAPHRVADMAAIHLRERTVAETVASLVRQLGLSASVTTAPDAVDAVLRRAAAPLIVVDALDEAVGQLGIIEDLLLPLARSRRPDGRQGCRLLVGMRPWDQFAPLRDLAADSDGLLDLDRIPIDELRTDLAVYLDDVLAFAPAYGSNQVRALRRELAQHVAAALTDADRDRGGEFLSAAMFANWLVQHHPDGIGQAGIAAVAARVPRGVPEMLEMDLSDRTDEPWLRPVLVAIAHAQGAGMPASVIRRLAPIYTDSAEQVDHLTAGEFDVVLKQVRFYLRSSPDDDGTTLYRIFHQGLIDQLRRDDDSLDALVDRLLVGAPQDESGARRWDAAEPYVRRHLARHAVDAGRLDELLDQGPTELEPLFNSARTARAASVAAVTRESARWGASPERAASWRDAQAINAVRYGQPQLARRLSRVANLPRPVWWPQWSTGSEVSPAARAVFTNPDGVVTSVDVAQVEGHPVAVAGTDSGWIRVWDMRTAQLVSSIQVSIPSIGRLVCGHVDGRPVAVASGTAGLVVIHDLTDGRPLIEVNATSYYRSPCIALAQVQGRPVLVVGYRGAAVVWDIRSRERTDLRLGNDARIVTAISCLTLAGVPIAVVASEGRQTSQGTISKWDLRTCSRIGDEFDIDEVKDITCAELNGRQVVICCSHDRVWMWDLHDNRPTGPAGTGHRGSLECLAYTYLDGVPVAITGDSYAVRLWDVAAGKQITAAMTGHVGAVSAVAAAQLDGFPIAVSAGDRTVRLWSTSPTETDQSVRVGHERPLRAVAVVPGPDAGTAVTAGVDRRIHRWSLDIGLPVGDLLPDHDSTVRAMTSTRFEGKPVLVTGSEDNSLRVWDLQSGVMTGQLAGIGGLVRAVTCVHHSGRTLVAAAVGDTIGILDLATLRLAGSSLRGHRSWIHALLCVELPDGPIVVSGSDDGTVRLWDIATRSQIGEPLTGHRGVVNALAGVVINGRQMILSGGTDGTARLWDIRPDQMREVRVVAQHKSAIYAVASTTLAGRPVAVIGDNGLWTYHLDRPGPANVFSLPHQVRAVTATDTGDIVVAYGNEVALFTKEQRE